MAKLGFKLGFPYWKPLLLTTITQKPSEIPYSRENDIKWTRMPLIYSWALPHLDIGKFPGPGIFTAQSDIFPPFPAMAFTSLGWAKKAGGYWASLSGDVLGAFPTQACSMSAQSRAQPFSSDLPQGKPQTSGGLGDGTGLHHSRENDVKGNTCLPSLWKPVATHPQHLLPGHCSPWSLVLCQVAQTLFSLLCSPPSALTSNFPIKSYARQYNLMFFQTVPRLPLLPQRKWPPNVFLKQIQFSPYNWI